MKKFFKYAFKSKMTRILDEACIMFCCFFIPIVMLGIPTYVLTVIMKNRLDRELYYELYNSVILGKIIPIILLLGAIVSIRYLVTKKGVFICDDCVQVVGFRIARYTRSNLFPDRLILKHTIKYSDIDTCVLEKLSKSNTGFALTYRYGGYGEYGDNLVEIKTKSNRLYYFFIEDSESFVEQVNEKI